ncbi:galactan 1,3-beta-galactosidase [Punctularia strigosozonata HHB-11173 SS5]|uniref:galactan 1,3-beta-galactosidase n=1 Tax=Punctularia strigosozonata (strain HHB-11173) TaxID=741275 RepID=UPI0004417C16|nr:galactan 1,3-beta-galactosidase [Punctularia strigosozonata HHB-11173 SS5]EIN13160.1 galactan 1,3-beta-galactosidase [Punctularia strigosozonata HHB-11173 SS5]
MIFLLSFLLAVARAAVIVPGAAWTDTSGNVIQAHGGGFLTVGSTRYWFGEDKSANSALFKAVSCYSSSDLITWTRQNDALTPISGTNISTSNIVERPKVIFNKKNSEYVMWFHSDTSNYGAAMVGVATAKTPCGPYSYRGSFKPFGADSRDMGLFQDDDSAQTSYLLYASDNNQNFKISQLDGNYYTVQTQVAELSGATLEAPGIVKRNGVYWLFASHTSGWAPNPNKYFSASSISGTWSSQADIAPEANRTYFSQNNYDFPLGSSAIYMGDRWRPDLLGSSRYMWFPLSWASGVPQIVYADVWSLDLAAGTYAVASGTTYEAESGTRAGSSTLITNGAFSGGRAVGYLGNGGTVTINDVQGTGSPQWVSLYYANGDSSWRNVTVSVNGGATVYVDQPDTGNGLVTLSVPVKLTLKSGSNSLTFGSGQSNYAGDLDKIVVYTAT